MTSTNEICIKTIWSSTFKSALTSYAPKDWSQFRSVWFSSIWFSFHFENWKSKLHNHDFQCLIPQKFKIKIYNLSFQCLLLRKVKLNIIPQYFENQKLKIENGQLVVLTFCFQFPLPKIQAVKNSNLTKQFMCNCVTAGWNTK